MAQTVSTIADRVRVRANTISGGRLEDSDIREFINNFFRFSRRKYLLPWTKRTQDLEIYDGVYVYPAPSDLVVPIEPQKYISADQNDNFNFHSTTAKEFARNLNNTNDFAIDWERGTKFLNIRHSEGVGGSQIHNMDDVDDNGTWSVTGDGSGLDEDTGNFIEGSASLFFNVTNSGNTVTLTNSNFTALDLSDGYENASTIFFWLYLPVTGLSSVRIRLGSSASNYVQRTVTTNFDGSEEKVGWNLIGLPWDGSASSTTPTLASITYCQILLTGTPTGSRYRIDDLKIKKKKNILLPYYSNLLANNNAGTGIELVSAQDDSVLGDEDFLECCTLWATLDAFKYKIKDKDGVALIQSELNDALKALASRYPSQEARVSTNYFSLNLLRA